MKVTVGSASDIGQVREGNEDSMLVIAPLYAVADGMGGHRGGEVASHLALDTVQRLFEQQEGTLADQVVEANRAVYERSQQDRSVAGMGTTLTAVLVDGNRVHLAHVGDSRAYLFRGGELTLLTEDHTLVHRMVVEGEITEAEAETHPHRSILTRALGVDASVEVDEGDVEVAPGDRVLLCTDGLTGMVTEPQIREILSESEEPQDAVERLVKSANRAGGIDNITAVILGFEEDGDAALPHQPTVESTSPQQPPRRSDITIVGAPIPEPPPRSSASGVPRAAAPAPATPPRHRARSIGIGLGVLFGVVVVGAVGFRLYLDAQWFVGVSNGRVAIFRGIPAEVGGFELHSVVVETSIPARDAESLALYRTLPDGITADDRAGANEIVEQIRRDVAALQPTS
ncbi:MAG TPA: Stp1/IreP family PP2C-type Ser/Thr phosphatase [Actinomycetota bacterium]